MKKRFLSTLVAIVCALALAVGFVGCDNSGDDKKTVAVEAVTLDTQTIALEIDGTQTLTATVTPENATDTSVSWSSSAPEIASVENGKVTAKAAGTATITATAGNKKAECTVTVNAAPTKMSEADWQASLTAFATAKNFSLKLSVATVTAGEVKMVGDTYYDKGSDIERIFVKNGSSYERYDKLSADADWTKASTTQETYNSVVNANAYNLVTGGAQAFASNYSSFEFSGGKYTAATVTVTADFVLKDIEVSVTGNSISRIVCTQVGVDSDPDTLVTIDGIDTTTIELPKIKGPTEGLLYRIPKNKNYAEVYSMGTSQERDVWIDSTYQGKPVTTIKSTFISSLYAEAITSVRIPDSVTTIESRAFADCKYLETVIIPDSVTTIAGSAFENTAWLKAQPDGVVYAGKVAYAYKGNKSDLTELTLEKGTTGIASLAFYQCEYLTSVEIPDSVQYIGGQAFYDCIRLTSVTINQNRSELNTVESGAFENCAFSRIGLPAGMIRLGARIFAGNANIKIIDFGGSQADWNASTFKKDNLWNSSDEGNIGLTVICKDENIVVAGS